MAHSTNTSPSSTMHGARSGAAVEEDYTPEFRRIAALMRRERSGGRRERSLRPIGWEESYRRADDGPDRSGREVPAVLQGLVTPRQSQPAEPVAAPVDKPWELTPGELVTLPGAGASWYAETLISGLRSLARGGVTR